MNNEKLSDQIYKKVSQKIDLNPITDYKDVETIHALDGRDAGSIKAFTGEKIHKLSIAEISIAPGMDYINTSIKPKTSYCIPRFSVNYLETPGKIQFDVDLYPDMDLAIRQDYIDKYYEQLTDTYLKEKNAPYFEWKVSDRSWVRVSMSPYFFMSAVDLSNKDKVYRLVHAYLDLWLTIWENEKEVPEEEAFQIASRRNYILKMLLEREPERHILEKAFGKDLAARMGDAMV
jgi:hypothetical protein